VQQALSVVVVNLQPVLPAVEWSDRGPPIRHYLLRPQQLALALLKVRERHGSCNKVSALYYDERGRQGTQEIY